MPYDEKRDAHVLQRKLEMFRHKHKGPCPIRGYVASGLPIVQVNLGQSSARSLAIRI